MPRPLRLTPALVAKIPSTIPDPGEIADIAPLQTADAQARALDDVLSTRPDPDQLWVFAFGSLIWKPDFPFAERRAARVDGWHRSFCLGHDTRYRGNPENPGIMLSLDRGGTCDGVAYRVEETRVPTDLAMLIAREPPIPPEWVRAATEQGSVSALAFVCVSGGLGHIGDMSPDAIARQIAAAVGMFGSMADYVYNTVSHLEGLGIHDQAVWQMQDLVAAELEAMP